MSINNVRLLRALIREMVTEAPYRSSQRVVLGGVRFDGTPNIRGMLMAGGIVGLINLYDWAADLCTVSADNNTFPIKLSKAAAAVVESSDPPGFPAKRDLYLATIARSGTAGASAATSDLANLEDFYAAFEDAAGAWPRRVPKEGLGLGERGSAATVLVKLKGILGIYTGCGETITLEEIPMETRDEYIKFLNDIGDMASSTFKAGLEEQMIRMTSAAEPNASALKTKVDASIKFSDSLWDSIKKNLKQ